MDVWSFETTIIFGTIDAVCVALLVFLAIVGRMRPKALDGVYYRDIPKTDNPVQAAAIALSYKNPRGRTLEDIIPEKDLVSFVILDCLDKGKIKISEDKIELNWQMLSDAERQMFEKFSLVNSGKAILGDKWETDCPFEKINDEDYVIHLDRIEKYAELLDSRMEIKGNSQFRELINCKDWFLVLNFLDRQTKKKFKIRGKFHGVSSEVQALKGNWCWWVEFSVKLAIISFPLVILWNLGNPNLFVSNPFLIAYCVYLVPPTLAKTISFIVERFEKYTPEELELTKQVRGLKNWIEDFTTLKNEPPEATIVWGDFVRWGYLLGVSEKAINIAHEYSNVEIVKPPECLENAFATRLVVKTVTINIILKTSPFPINWFFYFYIRLMEGR